MMPNTGTNSGSFNTTSSTNSNSKNKRNNSIPPPPRNSTRSHGSRINTNSTNYRRRANRTNSSVAEKEKKSTVNIIAVKDLVLEEKVGAGSRGQVHKGQYKGKIVAIKTVIEFVEEEAEVLSSLHHPNIIGFIGACIVPPQLYLVTEFATYGSLYAFLRKTEISFDRIIKWAIEISQAGDYLHYGTKQKIIHRDLKSMNVLVCDDYVVKLCDFGSSRLMTDTTMMTMAGTIAWCAPEVIRNEPISEKCDIYSFGVLLWEMLTREIPFQDLEMISVIFHIGNDGKLPIPESCPESFVEFLNECWNSNPKERPSFAELIPRLTKMRTQQQLIYDTDAFISSRADWRLGILAVFDNLKLIQRNLDVREKMIRERENELKKQQKSVEEEIARKFKELEELRLQMHNLHAVQTLMGDDDPENSNLTPDFENWTVGQVALWISQLRPPLCQYAHLFRSNHINGSKLVRCTQSVLYAIGIPSLGHREDILNEIRLLKYNQHFPKLGTNFYSTNNNNNSYNTGKLHNIGSSNYSFSSLNIGNVTTPQVSSGEASNVNSYGSSSSISPTPSSDFSSLVSSNSRINVSNSNSVKPASDRNSEESIDSGIGGGSAKSHLNMLSGSTSSVILYNPQTPRGSGRGQQGGSSANGGMKSRSNSISSNLDNLDLVDSPSSSKHHIVFLNIGQRSNDGQRFVLFVGLNDESDASFISSVKFSPEKVELLDVTPTPSPTPLSSKSSSQSSINLKNTPASASTTATPTATVIGASSSSLASTSSSSITLDTATTTNTLGSLPPVIPTMELTVPPFEMILYLQEKHFDHSGVGVIIHCEIVFENPQIKRKKIRFRHALQKEIGEVFTPCYYPIKLRPSVTSSNR